jgi:hypothetical protein
LLLLVVFTLTFKSIQVASATSLPKPTGSAINYASIYYQPEYEKIAAQNICGNLTSFFSLNSYEVNNAYGTGTIKSNVLSWASSKEQGFHRVAIFHFGHGGVMDRDGDGYLHYDYFDSQGATIWDDEIYVKTGLGKHFFVLLWTCFQGNEIGDSHPRGMPYCWTHGATLSTDGYANPDSGLYCFIGFYKASPALAYRSFQNYTVLAKDFILKFYYYALSLSYSIKDALNLASIHWFGLSFVQCPLYTGFKTWWPGNDPPAGWYEGAMRVYGNGNIRLYQYSFTVLAKDQYGNYFANKDVYIDLMHNLANTSSTIKITGGYHTVFVNDFWEPGYTGYRYTFQYYTYDGTTYYPNPAYWNFYKDWTVTANFVKEYCPGDVDGDGDADQTDWNIFNNYAYPSVRGDPNWKSRCDFNSDGDVDAEDRNYLYSIIYRGNEIASCSGSLSGTGATYTFSIPNLAGTYTVVLVGNELADFDLYAKWNSPPTRSNYDARGFTGYSSEYFTITGSGTLYIMIDSWSGSGNWRVNVVAGSPSASSGRKVGSLSGTGATSTYSLAGSGRAWVYLAGPDGSDFDLYLKWNSPPTTSSYDARGFSSWAHEIVTCTGSGTLYYMVHSYSGSGEYTMLAFIF